VDRRQKAFAHIDLGGRGLEIGPSHSPLLPKSSGARIQIVDHAGRANLIEKYRAEGIPSDLLDNIEEVDYVWTKGRLVDLIGEPGAFDYIVCSHVVEHMVDLIDFLQDCEALLTETGRFSLIIPDKRYCFDLFEPLTTVGATVNGHLSTSPFHPFGSVLDHHAYSCVRGPGVIAWDSVTTTPIELRFEDLGSGSEEVERGRRQDEYVDVHRWMFTPTSFRLLLQDLRDLGYVGLAEVGGFDTAGCEFFITLARTQVPPPREDRLTMLLRIDQELRSAVEPVVPAAELQRHDEAAAAELEGLRAASAAELQRHDEAAAAELEGLRAASAAELQRHDEAAAAELEGLRAALSECEQTLTGVLTSNSWRVTGPLRALSLVLRRKA
jgi:SAM-dependent methyltransferase